MFLGIDISKLNFDAALLTSSSEGSERPPSSSERSERPPSSSERSERPRHRAFPNTPLGFERLGEWLGEWLGEQKVHACLEATGTYGDALARFLHDHGHTVSVVNPAQIRAFGQTGLSRTKTDKADAILIARFCALHRPEPWTPPAPEAAALQALVHRLEALRQMQQMERNRLDVSPAPVRASIEAVLTVLAQQAQATEQAIQDQMSDSQTLRDQCALLVSIPGISDATAAAILAGLRDVRQFAGPRQVAAFAGLVPRIRQSGSSVRGRGGLSKSGSPRLRKALYFPALVALRFNPAVKALGERLTAAGKSKMLIVGAAMRKLLQIAFGVLKSGRPFDPNICRSVPAKA